MNEQDMYKWMLAGALTGAAIAGLSTVAMLIVSIAEGLWILLPTLLLGGITVGSGVAAVYFGGRITGHEKVFSNPIEREVLTVKQRRELRLKRGELVMQWSLNEIENERDNIIHRQIEAANDPDKPPHQTRFSPEEEPRKKRLDFISEEKWRG